MIERNWEEGSVFKDAVVIITGAASGIGRGFAEALGREGAIVIAADIDGAGAARVAAAIEATGGRAEAAALDITDRAATEALIAAVCHRHGVVKFVFANAGIAVAGELADTTATQWRRLVEVNLLGTVATASAAFAAMKAAGGGHIVISASLAGLIGSPVLAAYAATKAALVMFGDALRREGRDYGIRVTTLCPGFIDTAITTSCDYAGIDRSTALGTNPLPVMPLEAAIPRLLDGVRRNRALVLVPAYSGLLWRLQRLAPALAGWIQLDLLRKIRRAKAMTYQSNQRS